MARVLNEGNSWNSTSTSYSGHFSQSNMIYVGCHNDIPEIDRDLEITATTGKDNIFTAIKKLANTCDSYDNVLFYYTSHGKYLYRTPPASGDDEPTKYNKRGDYVFDANDVHNPYSSLRDLNPNELSDRLDSLITKKIYIILQPCYSGNWIDFLDNKPNRVIITSEEKTQNIKDER